MKPRLLLLPLITALSLPAARAVDNALTTTEKSAGWQLLFDGTTFKGWRGYRQKAMPAAGWEIKDGLLICVAKGQGGAIITDRKFDNFELSWDWRIALAGNNGIKYLVTEDRPQSPGHEYQIIDDERHPDATKGANRQTAAFYDVLAATNRPSRPAGEWNSSRIVVKGRRIEHWLNGTNVLTYELGSAEVKAGLAKSKFVTEAGFGDKIAGHIMLTYHGDECAFRNLKIRELP